MITLDNFSPVELSLPEKFEEFRPAQIEAIEKIVNSTKRFVLAELPTGTGKTLIGMGVANTMGARAAALTSTLGLQEQYLRDFREIGLQDVRGRANYQCNTVRRENCKLGPHAGCPHVTSDGGPLLACTYGQAKIPAMRSRLVLTNYAYWIRIGGEMGLCYKDDLGEVVNPFDLLILDEAHRADKELGRTLQIQLNEPLLRKLKIDYRRNDDIDYWMAWAAKNADEVKTRHKEALAEYRKTHSKEDRKHFQDLEFTNEFIGKLLTIIPKHWVCQMRGDFLAGHYWLFDPIWPANWSHKLFGDIPKVLLMSATLRPIQAGMLGINKGEFDFFEWPRVFPPQRTPILHIPTVRMNHSVTQADLDKWVARIDQLIESRLDRKGLIHTVSYQRQEYLVEHSKFGKNHADIMVVNSNKDADSESAAQVAERFKKMPAPAVLVSPVYGTGWDFPDDECRYQIIAKLPFPDSRDKLMQARLERNEQYVNNMCMQDLQQSAGRGTRSEDDWCEVFIVDDSVGWFMHRNKALASRWFSVQMTHEIPEPMSF